MTTAAASPYSRKPWLSSYEAGVPEHIDYEPICLPTYLERSVERFPDGLALLFEGYRLSYRGLGRMVDGCAAALAGFGIAKGDRVAILLPNVIPCVAAYYAVLKLGAIVVMNNPLYADRELSHQFNDSGASALITLDLLAARMIALRPATGIRHIVVTSIGDYLPFPKSMLFPLVARRKKLAAAVPKAPQVHRWKPLLAAQEPGRLPAVALHPDDLAMYQYTGGTTGISKGVMLTHGNLSRQTQQIAAWFPAFDQGNEIMLGALPFFHVFGLSTAMNFAIAMGWANVLVPKPQAPALIAAIRKWRPTFAPLVPTMYIGILNHPDIDAADMTCIKGCFSGSAPLPVEVIRKFEQKTGATIVEGYGLTEASPVSHVNPFAGGRRKVGSIGVPIPDTACRIVDLQEDTRDVPLGEPGELLLRGPQVMQGYWNMPGETAATLKDGWLHTGDIATMDADGYFTIVDRKKDMIISGGLNVYPRDIEEVYYQHPKIQEVTAIGIPHPTRGEAVKLFAVLKQDEQATAEEIIAYGADQLARFKLPVEVEFRAELPKTNVGKVLRKQLRADEMAKHRQPPA